jgi:murein L,D-transpeptidase YafK
VVFKKERTLQLLSQGKVIRTCKVALGGDPVGAKTRQGDYKTPEGRYALDSTNAHSHFYKSIHISYPSASDRAVARQKGIAPGGEVFLHGLPNGYGGIDAVEKLLPEEFAKNEIASGCRNPDAHSLNSGGNILHGEVLVGQRKLRVAG